MKSLLPFTFLVLVIFIALKICSCDENNTEPSTKQTDTLDNQKQFVATMQRHLDAVSNKDLKALTSTMSPEGKMQLILPGSPITHSVDSFLKFHEEWFADSSWTFDTRILNTEVGDRIGIAVTEVVYKEPERDGKPYFNKMIVSYGLEKTGDQWYIIKDHACSVEKSTDVKQ